MITIETCRLCIIWYKIHKKYKWNRRIWLLKVDTKCILYISSNLISRTHRSYDNISNVWAQLKWFERH